MKNEMDVLRMTEPERICWLKANRVTLMAVGVVWVGMVIQQLSSGNRPWFLIAMIPTFALLRFTAYVYYRKLTSK